jgi:hypothetical protein
LTRVGIPVAESPREASVCQYIVLPETDDLLIVPDTQADPRLKTLPGVVGTGARFYAASSIRLNDVKIGCLCVVDTCLRPDFDKEKEKKLIELGNTISDMIFEKKNLEFGQEENLKFDIITNLCKEIISSLHSMMRNQNELTHLNRLLSPKTPTKANKLENVDELLVSFDNLKKELYDKRHSLQTLLTNGLTSIDKLKKSNPVRKNQSAPLSVKPTYNTAGGEYTPVNEWFQKVQQMITKNIPNYGKFASNIKFELVKLNSNSPANKNKSSSSSNSSIDDYEMNEANLSFVTILLSVLIVNQLQKWRNMKVSFMIFPDTDNNNNSSTAESSNNNANNNNNTNTKGKNQLTIKTELSKSKSRNSAHYSSSAAASSSNSRKEGSEAESEIRFLSGRLCIELKGYGSLKSTMFSSKTLGNSKNTEEFPLFPEENQFFSICDNFISNSFQIITGEYQKYCNRNDEMTNFWLPCYMREDLNKESAAAIAKAKLTAQKSKSNSFWNRSINNLLTSEWWNKNNSTKNRSAKSNRSFSAFSIDDLWSSNKTTKTDKIVEVPEEEEESETGQKKQKKTANTAELSILESPVKKDKKVKFNEENKNNNANNNGIVVVDRSGRISASGKETLVTADTSHANTTTMSCNTEDENSQSKKNNRSTHSLIPEEENNNSKKQQTSGGVGNNNHNNNDSNKSSKSLENSSRSSPSSHSNSSHSIFKGLSDFLFPPKNQTKVYVTNVVE